MNNLPDGSLQLAAVLKDSKLSIRAFAKLMDMSHVSIYRMLKGQQAVNSDVVNYVCNTLGYSTQWFILGTGPKKLGKSVETQLITEVSMLQTEMEIMIMRNKLLEDSLKKAKNKIDLQSRLFLKLAENMFVNTVHGEAMKQVIIEQIKKGLLDEQVINQP